MNWFVNDKYGELVIRIASLVCDAFTRSVHCISQNNAEMEIVSAFHARWESARADCSNSGRQVNQLLSLAPGWLLEVVIFWHLDRPNKWHGFEVADGF